MRVLFYLWKLRNKIINLLGGKTAGARGIVLDENEKVLLVRHSYKNKSYWALPGGGIENNELPKEALQRELEEEVDAKFGKKSSIKSFRVYCNFMEKRYDIIFIYIVRGITIGKIDKKELEEAKFFGFDELPKGLYIGHKRRLEEFLEKRKISEKW